MPLTGKTADEIKELENEFIQQVPQDGSSIGNKALRDVALRWDRALYDAIKSRLLDDGRIVSGRGRGGSVKRFVEQEIVENEEEEAADAIPADPFPTEESLYESLIVQINEAWAKDQPFDRYAVENTSRGGRRADGTWSRPDICVAAMTSYTYVPGRIFDVITFEVKHYSGLNLTALYEALAHRRSATRSYVLAYVPENQEAAYEDRLKEIEEECQKTGIGLIVAINPNSFDDWDIRVEAQRFEPDATRLNNFIRAQLTEGTRDAIVRWFRV